jgi:hypothetical protein
MGPGSVCCDVFLPKYWKARTSFEAAFRAVIILHCDDQPMTATAATVYPSEKDAAQNTWDWLVTCPKPQTPNPKKGCLNPKP